MEKVKRKKRVIQGTYITEEAQAALIREAERQDKFVTRLASEILEQTAAEIMRREREMGL